MVLWIILAIVAIFVIWFIATYNSFIKLKNGISEAFATMDVYLKKRFDLIPNLVETVKGYATHESETIDKVVRARSQVSGSATMDERIKNENALSGTLRTLFAVAEAYPDLKANTNFLELQSQLHRMEDEIASSRKYYNAIVKKFNTKCETFPGILFASMFGFSQKAMYEVDSKAERENIKVDFK